MKIKKLILSVAIGLMTLPTARADKGMWLLNELKKENVERMRELGFKLDPQQLFDNNAPGIANAVVIFGGGCTGITVSDEGLIFTNHHCGYGAIQSQSSVEHDYLRDGFVSHAKSEELPIPGLSVRYLREVIDVTDQIIALEKSYTTEEKLYSEQAALMKKLAEEYETKNPSVEVNVYPFYERNKFYLISYDVFEDVRLAFAPPSSVGKFGHDSDNWMWPRHTNDFSVFRVYADANNKPAQYSPNNKPYRPRYVAKVSLGGVKEGDYAMTIGFPGSTDRYLSSWGVQQRMENENAPRILMRGLKQEVWMKHMKADQATNIMYSSKYAGSSNYWKNSIGMNRGLKRLNIIDSKRQIEQDFAQWVAAKPARTAAYGQVLDSLRIPTLALNAPTHDLIILSEGLSGTEFRSFAATVSPLAAAAPIDIDQLYKDFSPTVARATLPVMLKAVKENVAPENLPSIYGKIDSEFGGDYEAFADYVYDNSIFLTKDRLKEALKDQKTFAEVAPKDIVAELNASFMEQIYKLYTLSKDHNFALLKGRRLFMRGLQEMNPNVSLPSDANFTMRLSYGSVMGYKPYDNAWYHYFTTQQGVFEKQDSNSYEYAVQPEILALLRDKANYGQYADKDGDLHVNFISNNDITGGNSGSPVFNGEGHLIGLAFDGNWEAMSGDIEFEPALQRTISVDIRYVLFFIDKWGKADNLMKEITLVK